MTGDQDFKIEVCTPENAQRIVDGINEYNFSKVPALSENWKPLEFIVKNEHGLEIAGVLGGIDCYLGLEINILWVKEEYRTKGLGSTLLKHMETVAVENGATIAVLDTFDFQAEGFYLKNGYKIIGEIKDYPKNYRRIYLTKKLI